MTTGVQYRLPANHRVKSRRDFLTTNRSGRLSSCPHFLVFTLKKADGPTRLGVTVTRKIGGAVVRNRIKRHLREFFRVEYEKLPLVTDISVIAKQGAEKLTFQDIQQELRTVFFSSKELVDR